MQRRAPDRNVGVLGDRERLEPGRFGGLRRPRRRNAAIAGEQHYAVFHRPKLERVPVLRNPGRPLAGRCGGRPSSTGQLPSSFAFAVANSASFSAPCWCRLLSLASWSDTDGWLDSSDLAWLGTLVWLGASCPPCWLASSCCWASR